MDQHIKPVELAKAYRLLNHGPTVLVSASHEGVQNVMSAAWSCALDFAPPKVTLVLDKATATRPLVENSGYFVRQVPNMAQLQLTYDVGHSSANEVVSSASTAGALASAGSHPGPGRTAQVTSGCAAASRSSGAAQACA